VIRQGNPKPASPHADDILANAQTYAAQIYKVLDPAMAMVRFNSEWLGQLTPRRL